MSSFEYKYTCLLLEDNPIHFKLYSKLISEIPYLSLKNDELCCEKNDIYDKIETHKPDLLIFDIELTDCNAFEIIDNLPKMPYNNYHIVLLTEFYSENKDKYINFVNKHILEKTIVFLSKEKFSERDILTQTFENLKQKINSDTHRVFQFISKKKENIISLNFPFIDIIALEYIPNGISRIYIFNKQHQIERYTIEHSVSILQSKLLTNKFFIQISKEFVINTIHIKQIKSLTVKKADGSDESRNTYHIKMPFHENLELKENYIKVTNYFSKSFLNLISKKK